MASIMVHIRINKELKEEACTNLELMGLSLSEAVRLLLVRIATEGALPFEVRIPNVKTKSAMESAKANDLIEFSSFEELMSGNDEKKL